MKLQFDFAINKPKTRIRLMGMPMEELKNYGSKEAAVVAVIETPVVTEDTKTNILDREVDEGYNGEK